MKDITKQYTNGEVTIVWKPDVCIHSTNCFKGLGNVFDPRKRPWVNPHGATTAEIIEQVKQCPSGALKFFMNSQKQEGGEVVKEETRVEVITNGPLRVMGTLSVKMADGSVINRSVTTSFCRCGGSGNKPFCDGSHKKNGFEG
jgi:uncharacterized Fe-S cluster protein YjdI